MAILNAFDYRRSEVVFGVVAAVGTDTSQLGLVLREHLKRFNYQVDEIKLSAYLQLPKVRKKHGARLRLRVCKEITGAILGAEAPDPARREEGEYPVYSTDEQRRGAECLGGQNASVISLQALSAPFHKFTNV